MIGRNRTGAREVQAQEEAQLQALQPLVGRGYILPVKGHDWSGGGIFRQFRGMIARNRMGAREVKVQEETQLQALNPLVMRVNPILSVEGHDWSGEGHDRLGEGHTSWHPMHTSWHSIHTS